MQEEKEVVNEEAKAAGQSEEAKTEQDAAKAEKKDAKEAEKEDKKSAKFGKKKKIEELEEEIVKLKEEAAANKNAYFKAYADTENLKKRLQSEATMCASTAFKALRWKSCRFWITWSVRWMLRSMIRMSKTTPRALR